MSKLFSYDFNEWSLESNKINDTSNQLTCSVNSAGVSLQGLIDKEHGLFLSFKSPVFSPSIDLSGFKGFQLKIDGRGRTLKFLVSCKQKKYPFAALFQRGLTWVAEIETNNFGATVVRIPFTYLEPRIPKKIVSMPVEFNSSSITQFQFSYSTLEMIEKKNSRFNQGKVNIILNSISVYS